MILPYKKEYLEALLQAFDSNVPDYFDPTERPQFKAYIEKEPENYFVLIKDDEIVGSGGFALRSPEEGRIVWLLITKKHHGKSLGRELMAYLESEIMKSDRVDLISLMTSQLTDKFYEKLDYHTIRTEKDYWAKGMDLYYMEKEMHV